MLRCTNLTSRAGQDCRKAWKEDYAVETEFSAIVEGSAGKGQHHRLSWPRPKYLLFGFIGLMYAYVLWTDESFLFNSKDPEWVHIDSFKW